MRVKHAQRIPPSSIDHSFEIMKTTLVGGLEHFLFSHILGMSSSQLTFIFFRGVGIPPTRWKQSILGMVNRPANPKCWFSWAWSAGEPRQQRAWPLSRSWTYSVLPSSWSLNRLELPGIDLSYTTLTWNTLVLSIWVHDAIHGIDLSYTIISPHANHGAGLFTFKTGP